MHCSVVYFIIYLSICISLSNYISFRGYSTSAMNYVNQGHFCAYTQFTFYILLLAAGYSIVYYTYLLRLYYVIWKWVYKFIHNPQILQLCLRKMTTKHSTDRSNACAVIKSFLFQTPFISVFGLNSIASCTSRGYESYLSRHSFAFWRMSGNVLLQLLLDHMLSQNKIVNE